MIVLVSAAITFMLFGLKSSSITQIPKDIILNLTHHDHNHHQPVELVTKKSLSDSDENLIVNNKIRLSNIYGLHMDVNRAAVYYTGDRILVITLLLQTRVTKSRKFDVKLIVRIDNEIVIDNPVDIFMNQPYSNQFYIFSVLRIDVKMVTVTSASRLTYQFNVNGHLSAEFKVNFVNTTLSVGSKKTARLIKCMWMPQDSRTFEYIIKLIIEARYDSIYLCLFSSDTRLKNLLAKFNSRQKVYSNYVNFMLI